MKPSIIVVPVPTQGRTRYHIDLNTRHQKNRSTHKKNTYQVQQYMQYRACIPWSIKKKKNTRLRARRKQRQVGSPCKNLAPSSEPLRYPLRFSKFQRGVHAVGGLYDHVRRQVVAALTTVPLHLGLSFPKGVFSGKYTKVI